LAAVQPQQVKPPHVQSHAPSSVPTSAPAPLNTSNQETTLQTQQRMNDTLLQLSQAQQLQYQIQQHQNKLQQQLAEMNCRGSPTQAKPTGNLIQIPPPASTSMPVTPAQPDASKQQEQRQKRKAPSISKDFGQKKLKEAYERHVRSQQPSNGLAMPAAAQATLPPAPQQEPRTEEDKAGGNALFGFLLSLRKSYEDALRSGNDSSQSWREPARVSDDSNGDSGETNQPESSVEDSDWNSDKKTDPSSSEESDKDERTSIKKANVSHETVQQKSTPNHEDIHRHGRHFKHGDTNQKGSKKGKSNQKGVHRNRSKGGQASSGRLS
jgi:hypothetical protein